MLNPNYFTSRSQADRLKRLSKALRLEGTNDLWLTPQISGYRISSEKTATSLPCWSHRQLVSVYLCVYLRVTRGSRIKPSDALELLSCDVEQLVAALERVTEASLLAGIP